MSTHSVFIAMNICFTVALVFLVAGVGFMLYAAVKGY